MTSDVVAAVREVAASIFAAADMSGDGFDATSWRSLEAAGFTRLTVPDSAGGGGAGLDLAAAVLLEAGAHAARVPLAETDLLAGWLLAGAGIALPAGPLTAVAVAEHDLDIARDGAGWRIRAELSGVPWARCAAGVAVLTPRLVVLLDTWQVVPGSNLAGEPRDTVVVDGVVGGYAVAEADGAELGHELRLRAALARTQLLAGALSATLSAAVRYAGERTQFGRPIARFQAVQQQLALAAGEVAAACTAAEAAAAAATSADVTAQASVIAIASAKARASEAAGAVASIAHQVHGAIGFTREHPLRVLTTRLWAWRDEDGSDAYWNGVIGARALSLGPAGLWPMLTSSD
jgi:acyl-CoA dehydrogenase